LDSALHVDIVRNEWSAGLQILLARVEPNGEHVRFTRTDPSAVELLQRPILQADGSQSVHLLDLGPTVAFEALRRTFDGSYLFATDPHTEDVCQFRDRDVITMRRFPSPAPSASDI
jgi:hypothetical protein